LAFPGRIIRLAGMPRDTPRPLVSILLPARNAEATLPSCIRSIRRQTLTDWECVIVDDGSSDGTLRAVRELSHRDDRFAVVPAGYRGLVAALNTGLAHCRGEFVARMDADDLMHRLRLEDQVALLNSRPDLAAVGCHVRLFPRERMGEGYRSYEAWLNAMDSADRVERDAFIECPVAHPTLVIRRFAIQELGYRDLEWPEDYDLVQRMLARGDRIGVLPRRRLSWRLHPGRLSLTDPTYGLDRFTACKAAFLAGSFLAADDRYVLWGYGATGRSLRRELERLGKLPSHIVELHPGRLGNRIHDAPVVPPTEIPGLPRHPIVVSVAGELPRSQIRDALESMGFVELRDFVCAA